MSSSKSELRESLECSICVDLFDEPKQLSCGHTFCLQCVTKITTHQPGFNYNKVIRCPFCQKVTEIPLAGLRTNYVIKDLVNKMQKVDIDQEGTSECSVCKKTISVAEIAVCKTCSESFIFQVRICPVCALKVHEGHSVSLLHNVEMDEQLKARKAFVEAEVVRISQESSIYMNKLLNAHLPYETIFSSLNEVIHNKYAEYDGILCHVRSNNSTQSNLDLLYRRAKHLNQKIYEVLMKTVAFQNDADRFVESAKEFLNAEPTNENDVVEPLPTFEKDSGSAAEGPTSSSNVFAYYNDTPSRRTQKNHLKRKAVRKNKQQ